MKWLALLLVGCGGADASALLDHSDLDGAPWVPNLSSGGAPSTSPLPGSGGLSGSGGSPGSQDAAKPVLDDPDAGVVASGGSAPVEAAPDVPVDPADAGAACWAFPDNLAVCPVPSPWSMAWYCPGRAPRLGCQPHPTAQPPGTAWCCLP